MTIIIKVAFFMDLNMGMKMKEHVCKMLAYVLVYP
jgi:hypothetical protein